jgi:hypothetical protein
MFINLSNHPSSSWGKEQTDAALLYGEIVNISFPTISPSDSGIEVTNIAKDYFKKVTSILGDNKDGSVIHLMGETVFVYVLASLLTKSGYTVVASTTERIVTTDGDKKISEFKFVQFRKFPSV